MKFNWKSNIKKSPVSRDEFEHQNKKNLTELKASCSSTSKHWNHKTRKSPEFHSRKDKPFIVNGLPPEVMKTSQNFRIKEGSVEKVEPNEQRLLD